MVLLSSVFYDVLSSSNFLDDWGSDAVGGQSDDLY